MAGSANTGGLFLYPTAKAVAEPSSASAAGLGARHSEKRAGAIVCIRRYRDAVYTRARCTHAVAGSDADELPWQVCAGALDAAQAIGVAHAQRVSPAQGMPAPHQATGLSTRKTLMMIELPQPVFQKMDIEVPLLECGIGQ